MGLSLSLSPLIAIVKRWDRGRTSREREKKSIRGKSYCSSHAPLPTLLRALHALRLLK